MAPRVDRIFQVLPQFFVIWLDRFNGLCNCLANPFTGLVKEVANLTRLSMYIY